jgi:plasmid maintenance system killer protein
MSINETSVDGYIDAIKRAGKFPKGKLPKEPEVDRVHIPGFGVVRKEWAKKNGYTNFTPIGKQTEEVKPAEVAVLCEEVIEESIKSPPASWRGKKDTWRNITDAQKRQKLMKQTAKIKDQMRKKLQMIKKTKDKLAKELKKQRELRMMRYESLDVPTMSAESLAKLHNVPLSEIESQIAKGIKIEKEHTTDDATAREIACDHIKENPKYYDKLKKIEESAKPAFERGKYSMHFHENDEDRGGHYSVHHDGKEIAKYPFTDITKNVGPAHDAARKHIITKHAEDVNAENKQNEHDYQHKKPLSDLEKEWLHLDKKLVHHIQSKSGVFSDKERVRWESLGKIARKSLIDGTHAEASHRAFMRPKKK